MAATTVPMAMMDGEDKMDAVETEKDKVEEFEGT